MNTIDLNIQNYSIDDLKRFFHLPPKYTETDLDNKEKDYIVSILSTDAGTMDTQKKYDLIMFLKKGKEMLLDNLTTVPVNTNAKTTLSVSKTETSSITFPKSESIQIGSIINPRGHVPAMQFNRNAIPAGAYGNGYGNNTIIRNYVFNTLFRDDFFDTVATDCSFTLSEKMTNVISLDLSALQFPNYYFTFSGTKRTNSIYIEEEETGNFAMVIIPNGNYDNTTMPQVLEQCINEQVVGYYDPSGNNRFTVSISPYTFFTTITNSTYNFFMVTNTERNSDNHSTLYVCQNVLQTRFFKTEKDIKSGVRPEQYFQSLGWLLGYRNQVYAGSNSYTSEGHFDNSLSSYVYLILRDYVNNQIENTYGILPGSILSKDILAVVPVTSAVFTSTFDNNANFIYKTRNYTGPVNITRISIQLCNPYGEPISLHSSDFAFCLQVTSIKDPKLFAFSEVPDNN